MKPTIIDNLSRACALIEAYPETNLDLSRFKQEVGCNTLFCAAGLLATYPHFQALGMRLVWSLYSEQLVLCRGSRGGYGYLDDIFGLNAFANLFNGYGVGDLDSKHPAAKTQDGVNDALEYANPSEKPITDKALVLWRIERQIELVTQGKTK